MKRRYHFRQLCLFMMSLGTMYSWTSPALPYLKGNNSNIHITDNQGSWIATLIDVGAFFGDVTLLFFSRFVGRKYWILILSIPYTLSFLVIVFANSIFMLYISRFICGLMSDVTSSLIVLYLGEIADKDIRGVLLIGPKLFINLGQLYAKTAGAFFSYTTMNIMMFFVPLIFLVSFLFMPESPYYLLLQNRKKQAVKVMMRLRGVKLPGIVDSDLRRMEDFVKKSQENEKFMLRELLCVKENRKSLLIVLTAWTTKFLSGAPSITVFTQEIFEKTEMSLAPEICTMILAIIEMLLILSGLLLIERLGKKLTFLLSGIFCSLGLSIVGLFFFFKNYLQSDVGWISWLPFFGLIIYVIAYSSGISYVPIILIGEMFALEVKVYAVLFTYIMMNLVIIFVKVSFQWMNEFSGIHMSFFMYAICTLVGSLIFFSIAPETEGRTLEEIQENLQIGSGDNPRKEQNNLKSEVVEKLNVSTKSDP